MAGPGAGSESEAEAGAGAGAGKEAWTLRWLAGCVASRVIARWRQSPPPSPAPALHRQSDDAAADSSSSMNYSSSLHSHRRPRSLAPPADRNTTTTDSSYSASTTDSVEDEEEDEEEEAEMEAEQTMGRGRRMRPATAPNNPQSLPAAPAPPQSASSHVPYLLHHRGRQPAPASPSMVPPSMGSGGGRASRRWSSVPQPQPLPMHDEGSRALCSVYPSASGIPRVMQRRVPPPSVMASSWWRNMEENSPAFAAISQRFHAIAHAQARERLSSSMVRLAALQEQERASRESEDALRFALAMPALAHWADTKATAPLCSFFLRTARALLDLHLELIRHAVLIGWVFLGVFNRLLMELMTAKRPVQTAAFFLGVVFASYVGIFGDLQDFEELFWD